MLDEATVRELCKKATREPDPQRAAELLSSLRRVIEMESDETRLRVRQILLHYRSHPAIAPPTGKPRNSMSSFVAALIAGIRPPSQRN
jgi:hypothetical protein